MEGYHKQTWEPVSNLKNAKDTIEDFHKQFFGKEISLSNKQRTIKLSRRVMSTLIGVHHTSPDEKADIVVTNEYVDLYERICAHRELTFFIGGQSGIGQLLSSFGVLL